MPQTHLMLVALLIPSVGALSNTKLDNGANLVGFNKTVLKAIEVSAAALPKTTDQEETAISSPKTTHSFDFTPVTVLLSFVGVFSIIIASFVTYMCLAHNEKESIEEEEDDTLRAGRLLGGKGEVQQYLYIDVVLSVLGFMAASAGMAIANKMAVSALKLPMLLVGIQCGVTLGILIPAYKTITLGSWNDKLRWFPVSVLFVGMLATSMIAYEFCTLGTVVVIRMVSPLLGLLVEVFFNRAKFVASIHTFGSLGVIMTGVVLYAVFQKGIGAEVLGIVFMLANMFVATGERLAQRYLMAESPVDISDTGLMLYNNAVCLLFMPLLMLGFDEWKSLSNFTAVTPAGWGFIIWSCLCGACISYTAFRAQRRISATSFLVVVNMNKFVVVAYGIVFLGESYQPIAAVGTALALLGGAYYSWDRSNLKNRSKPPVVAEAEATEETAPFISKDPIARAEPIKAN
uniref:Sugar phosphate transporter domain-containing protein n=1 Tax=Lotharella globosa TaxID=91324 RepID=A0A7S3Z3Q2_9EUKA|mmetsp:Transcript_3612/g.7322  ORF Transcript_3612/g.7322 Transcript_3612/m.7322 type:complete len:459 (-) Transcript_3612:168-1544(-)|eukprot:CAMPEP_0167819292 /NCGR_PEP_ID=MMETSP0112_2-20121227/5314_1 /TAXON_ID=91324 /ORGANISM="Lotharella globosa, Strain CCCM811" /LENGTH=458 /DNA_ID=CAMNT_0007719441 /DNA_START=32 /DNA_END=1408 /DNA_ORIENTATION=+